MVNGWQGLGGLALRLVGLYLGGAVLAGLAFFSMRWAGQRVLARHAAGPDYPHAPAFDGLLRPATRPVTL